MAYVGGAGNFTNLASPDDEDTTYLMNNGISDGNDYAAFKVTSALPAGATINSVTLYGRWKNDGAAGSGYLYFYSGGVRYLDTWHNPTAYTTYSKTWATNPATGLAWSEAQVNAGEWGFRFDGGAFPEHSLHITTMYVVIDYTPASPPTVTTQAVTAIAATTATGNGNVISDEGSAITERGTVIALAVNPTTADHKDTAAGTIGAYTTSITALTKGTLYHVRAYAINAIGTSYGADVSFTTVNDPTISTLAASVVSSTTARLNSQITFDGATGGGEPCTVTFVYAAGSGYANYAAVLGAVGSVETAVAGTYAVNQTPYLDITGLVVATTYSFAVKAINSTTTTVYGAVITFTTESGVYTPTNLSAIPTATTISLSWNKGVGAANSWISYLTASYPTVHTDGILVYSGTSSSCVVSGLSPGTTYYFSLWGFTGAVFSATYITIACTTSVTTENVTIVPPSEYATPTQWFQAPDYTRMSAFPLYDIINWGADQFQIPRGTSWFVIAIIFSMCIGLLIYKLSTNIPAAMFSIAVIMYICSMAGIMEMWLLLPFILIGVAAWVQGNRA
jgi:hypothetical protein